RRDREQHRDSEPGPTRGLQKPLDLALVERLHLAALRPRRFHGVGGVAREELPPDGLLQGLPEHAVVVEDGLRREPAPAVSPAALEAIREVPLDVERRELGEKMVAERWGGGDV